MDALNRIDRATVVGAAKSSYDTVYLLLAAGKKVNWIIRDHFRCSASDETTYSLGFLATHRSSTAVYQYVVKNFRVIIRL